MLSGFIWAQRIGQMGLETEAPPPWPPQPGGGGGLCPQGRGAFQCTATRHWLPVPWPTRSGMGATFIIHLPASITFQVCSGRDEMPRSPSTVRSSPWALGYSEEGLPRIHVGAVTPGRRSYCCSGAPAPTPPQRARLFVTLGSYVCFSRRALAWHWVVPLWSAQARSQVPLLVFNIKMLLKPLPSI